HGALDRIGDGVERKNPIAAGREAGANPLLQFLASIRSKPLERRLHGPRCNVDPPELVEAGEPAQWLPPEMPIRTPSRYPEPRPSPPSMIDSPPRRSAPPSAMPNSRGR